MHILFLSLTFAPRWERGGPPRIVYDYARQLRRLGHEVEVYTSDANIPTKSEQGITDSLQPVYYFASSGGWLRKFYYDYSATEIASFLRSRAAQIDLIHLFQTRCLPNAVALYAHYRFGIPIVLSAFGSLPDRGGRLKKVYDALFVRPLVRRAGLLLAQNEAEAAVYRTYGADPTRVHQVPLAVDLSEVPRLHVHDRASFRERYGIPSNARVTLFVGRLHATKGILELIDYFSSAAANDPKLWLVIVGHDEGMLAPALQAAGRTGFGTRVVFTGPMLGETRWQAYNAADVFAITPRVQEETSLASIEALAMGLPVFVTTNCGVPDLDSYGAGVTANAGDANDCRQKFRALLSESEASLHHRRQQSRTLVEDRFDLARAASTLASLYALVRGEQR